MYLGSRGESCRHHHDMAQSGIVCTYTGSGQESENLESVCLASPLQIGHFSCRMSSVALLYQGIQINTRSTDYQMIPSHITDMVGPTTQGLNNIIIIIFL
jgi:hypothetical protein